MSLGGIQAAELEKKLESSKEETSRLVAMLEQGLDEMQARTVDDLYEQLSIERQRAADTRAVVRSLLMLAVTWRVQLHLLLNQ